MENAVVGSNSQNIVSVEFKANYQLIPVVTTREQIEDIIESTRDAKNSYKTATYLSSTIATVAIGASKFINIEWIQIALYCISITAFICGFLYKLFGDRMQKKSEDICQRILNNSS